MAANRASRREGGNSGILGTELARSIRLLDRDKMSANEDRLYGDAVPHSFGLTHSPRLVTTSLPSSRIVVNRLKLGSAQLGLSPRIPPEDTHIVAIYMTPVEDHELLSRGRPFLRQGYAQGSIRIVNLTGEFSARIHSPHESVVFYMPQAALDDFTENSGLRPVRLLACEAGVLDATMHGLALTLLPAFERPAEAPQLFLDHIVLGACSHLTSRYGEPSRAALLRGGLSPRQLARAQAYIAAHHTENITLGDLARQANLSRSHFTRAFRQALGMAPYQWLLRYRIERAKGLMLHSDLSLERIALACGFSDQSHLTRIFKQTVAVSPGVWRRDRKGSS